MWYIQIGRVRRQMTLETYKSFTAEMTEKKAKFN